MSTERPSSLEIRSKGHKSDGCCGKDEKGNNVVRQPTTMFASHVRLPFSVHHKRFFAILNNRKMKGSTPR